MRTRHALTAALAAAALAGCATIVHGKTQEVGFSSAPTAARIMVDNKPLGSTPTVAKLSRKDNHVIRMELDGYQPFEATVTRGVSGWAWGNLVFGGIVGIAVDAVSGGLYKLSPTQIAGQMANTRTGAAEVTRDGAYVVVVLRPDPAWQKVGELTHE